MGDHTIQQCIMDQRPKHWVKRNLVNFLDGWQVEIKHPQEWDEPFLVHTGDGIINMFCQSTRVWLHLSNVLLDFRRFSILSTTRNSGTTETTNISGNNTKAMCHLIGALYPIEVIYLQVIGKTHIHYSPSV